VRNLNDVRLLTSPFFFNKTKYTNAILRSKKICYTNAILRSKKICFDVLNQSMLFNIYYQIKFIITIK